MENLRVEEDVRGMDERKEWVTSLGTRQGGVVCLGVRPERRMNSTLKRLYLVISRTASSFERQSKRCKYPNIIKNPDLIPVKSISKIRTRIFGSRVSDVIN